MTAPRKETPRTRSLRLGFVGAVAVAALALAACGSSSSKAATKTATKTAAATSSTAQLKLATANVVGLGKILVDDQSRTLYLLEDSAGKPVACTDASGCTKVWPGVQLPQGTTAAAAGTGVDASLLGTTGNAGDLATYGGFPVYRFARDTAAGQANGQGLQSFGGTWYVLDAQGKPVTKNPSASGARSTTTTKAKSSSGY